jgi:hypothetical protein
VKSTFPKVSGGLMRQCCLPALAVALASLACHLCQADLLAHLPDAGCTLAAATQSLIVTRTATRVHHNEEGITLHPILGRSVYISQINASIRRVASQLHMPLLDFELWSSPLGFAQYLIDPIHPGPAFLLEALNVLLNVYEQHRDCGIQPGGND